MKPRPQSRSGRPKDSEKRDAIIAAAEELFGSQGFDAVSMDQVAAHAGVSKMTIYSHFGDKETLFEMFLTSISSRMTAALASKISDALSLRERLETTGKVYLATIGGPLVPGMLLSTAAIRKNPALARRFYSAGPGRTRSVLIALIDDYVKDGELRVGQAAWAADDLLGLWNGLLPVRMMFGVGSPLTAAEIKRRAVHAVDIFLQAYGAASNSIALYRRN